MVAKIIIVGSTGKLGSKLLNYTHKNKIPIYCATCFKNSKKLLLQSNKLNIKNSLILDKPLDKIKFFKILEKNIQIIYFLDFGSNSLEYLSHFLKYNRRSIIAIANKEMIIAGGSLLQSKIKKTKNIFIPLDSEHFSLTNLNINNNNIQKIYITASGGPFYFNKKINLSSVTKNKVLSHPKWSMGYNNLIDSSNFINKILEIYELSHIFGISLSKIDFLISREAYIHSIVHYKDNTLSINAFKNDMIITLIKPLNYFFNTKTMPQNQNYLESNNLIIEKPFDKRFKILKYKTRLMSFSHSEQLQFMIINNSAHKLYLSDKLKYNNMVNYIMSELSKNSKKIKFRSIRSILKFISINNKHYKTNV